MYMYAWSYKQLQVVDVPLPSGDVQTIVALDGQVICIMHVHVPCQVHNMLCNVPKPSPLRRKGSAHISTSFLGPQAQ